MKVFLSHNFNDKPVVEPVALHLGEIFGRENVFYDSWSILPGDGIIDKMNEGLSSPDFVFYFVSKNSLASKMVDLEWQNALYKATKGLTKLIPIRIDGSSMPAVLMQNLYVDMHSIGIDAAIHQLVNICQGNNSFTPQHMGFQNLTYSISQVDSEKSLLTIRASHLLETDVKFLFLFNGNLEDFEVKPDGASMVYTNESERQEFLGKVYCAKFVETVGRTITPQNSLKFNISYPAGFNTNELVVLHHQSDDLYKSLFRTE